jgi:hypothetical protein
MTDTAHALLVATLTYETAERHHNETMRAVSAARKARDIAAVAHAEANPHPWLGRKVKRLAKRSSYSNEKTVQRGIVMMHDNKMYRRFRNHYPMPGETYVETMRGATAYSMDNQHGVWELDT